MGRKLLSASLFVLVSLFADLLPAQTIINGSFESPGITPGTFSVVTPTGWSGGSLLFNTDAPNGITSEPNVWPFAQDGDQYEDIGNESPTALTQAFTIATTNVYELAWYENTALTVGNFESPYSVSIYDSQPAVVVTGTFDAGNLGQWNQMSLSTLLVAGSYTLEFKPLGVFNGADTLIDNVTLTAVPEPASAIIFVAAIATVTLCMRRR